MDKQRFCLAVRRLFLLDLLNLRGIVCDYSRQELAKSRRSNAVVRDPPVLRIAELLARYPADVGTRHLGLILVRHEIEAKGMSAVRNSVAEGGHPWLRICHEVNV